MYNAIHTHTHSLISGSGGYDCQFAVTRCKATHGSHPWNVDLHEIVANRQAMFRTLQLMRHTITNHLRITALGVIFYVCFWIWGSAAPKDVTGDLHRLLHLVVCVANLTAILIRTTNP